MNSEPQFWFNPLGQYPKDMLEHDYNQIRSVVPPAEFRYYDGNFYFSEKGINLLLEACESGTLPDCKAHAWHIIADLTVMLRSPGMRRLIQDLIEDGDVEAAVLLHRHIERHEMYRKK